MAAVLSPGVVLTSLISFLFPFSFASTRAIMKKTAAYGHFGRNDPDFTWEQPKTLTLP